MSDAKQSKRTALKKEANDDFLLVTLHDLVTHGWKSNNDFRASYLGKLEDAMAIQFPGCKIKGTPHIVSRLIAWKKDYNSLCSILQRNGKQNARFMLDKSWPQFEAWKDIFGKDRANGSNAEVIMDVVNGLYSNEKQGSNRKDEDINLSAEDLSSNNPLLHTSLDSAATERSNHTSKDTHVLTPN
ncbi:hypothetical protein SASPL_135707 [Salvia splendens]|uniref:Myb/SANT-like domain-containing protein n=1 Tax=Salvia splendens TaxID=180675 RepID=A0A8X8ZGV3_SALSN|nr:hypothetical protein SASPL_135707 [Salvia splendens]